MRCQPENKAGRFTPPGRGPEILSLHMCSHAAWNEPRKPSTSDFSCSDCDESPFRQPYAPGTGAEAPRKFTVIEGGRYLAASLHIFSFGGAVYARGPSPRGNPWSRLPQPECLHLSCIGQEIPLSKLHIVAAFDVAGLWHVSHVLVPSKKQ